MTPQQIKARLIEKAGTINQVAAEIGEDRSQVSATINYHYIYQRIREKLAARYGVRFSKSRHVRVQQRRQLAA